jgi:hypothetical protein
MEPTRKLDHPPTWDRPASGVPKSPKPARIFAESGRDSAVGDQVRQSHFLPDRRSRPVVLLLAEWNPMPLLTSRDGVSETGIGASKVQYGSSSS